MRARQARGKSMDPTKVQVFHITQRCVRRAFLCGDDAVSGKSYGHRKQWIRDRLEFLASVFGVDVLTILACAMYVDLNPIRAAMAQTPETSDFTGAKDRLDDLQSAKSSPGTSLNREQTHAWERSGQGTKSGWMSPVEIDEASDPIGPDKLLAEDARRASSKGFLNLSLNFYLDLLDWTGRNLALGKRGAIPDHLEPILKRVGIASSSWCDLIEQFGRLFKRAVGSPQSLADEAEARGQKYLQAPGAKAFVSG